MSLRSGVAGWGVGVRLLHWCAAGLVLTQLAIGVWGVEVTRDLVMRFQLAQVHKSIGTLILAVTAVRIIWRLADPGPPMPVMPAWQAAAARAVQVGLLALLIALPLSGWVYAAASPTQDLLGIENRAFGWALPDPWVPGNAAIADAAGRVHAWLAIVLGAMILLHAAAALHHQFVRRDRLLSRMIRGS